MIAEKKQAFSEQQTATALSKTYIDFFSGCGGLSLGLGMDQWNGVFAIEKDKMAYSTFDHNLVDQASAHCHFKDWPEWLSREAHSIEDVLENQEILTHFEELKGKVTLVAGGPPCQGFSVAGARNGNDPRNLLVFKMIHAIELLKPLFCMVENVGGFEKKFVQRPLDGATMSVAEEAVHEIEQLGYNVGKITINAADYGVPQLRKRVIIFAISGRTALTRLSVAAVILAAGTRISLLLRPICSLFLTALLLPVLNRSAFSFRLCRAVFLLLTGSSAASALCIGRFVLCLRFYVLRRSVLRHRISHRETIFI